MARISTALVVVVALTHAARADQLVRNSQQYSNRSPAAATGRSGNATAAVSALLDRNGTTSLLVTAGRTDGTVAGNITKLQLKAFNANEQVAWTRNYINLSGSTQHLALPGFLRGQPIQTQVNIKGIDGARTDVVTVSGIVKRLPDLAVMRIENPARANAGDDVVITAVIAKRNGDTGARSSCVLRVDGTEVDRAQGIWVDAGGTVGCSFDHVFPQVGTRTIEVAVLDVDPKDYDPSNNAATSTIEITEVHPGPFHWSAGAANYRRVDTIDSDGWYEATDHSRGGDWSYSQTTDMHNEFAAMYGSTATFLEFPISVRVAGTADGIPVQSFTLANQGATYEYKDSQETYRSYSAVAPDGTTIWFVTYIYGGESRASIEISRSPIDARYYSSGYMHQWWNYHGGDYFYSFPPVAGYSSGAFWPMSSTFNGDWEITDATHTSLRATANLVLTQWNDEYHLPYTCTQYDPTVFMMNGYSCMSQDSLVTGVSAQISGDTP